MSSKLKKTQSSLWDRQPANEKPVSRDDYDSYISERSSIPSLNENSPLPKVSHHHKSTPIPPKEPNKLVYSYNQLPENGIPLAIQAKQTRKEEEKMRKELLRKAPPGQGNLASLPEPEPSNLDSNYYPYWYYYKATNPDWVMRYRQNADGQMVPYESFDPSRYVHQPVVGPPTKKHRRRHKKSHNDSFELQYNPDKKCYEWVRKNAKQSSSEYFTPLNDLHTNGYPNQPYGKPQTENDWNNHYLQSLTNNQVPVVSHTSKHDQHNSQKQRHDENNNHQHSSNSNYQHSSNPNHRHHHHHHRHHHHHQHHHHGHNDYPLQDYQVRDHSFKKSERTPFFQPTPNSFPSSANSFPSSPNSFPSSPPAIYNQSSYLPPLPYDKPNTVDYSSTQTRTDDWKTPSITPKIHKRDSQSNFYDRYLNTVIAKKLIE